MPPVCLEPGDELGAEDVDLAVQDAAPVRDLVLLLVQLVDQLLELVVGEAPRSGSGSTGAFRPEAGALRSKAAGDPRVNLSLRFRPLASAPFALHDLLDELAQLRLELDRELLGLALGVDVHERLVRVREHLRPAALVEDLDPVE